MSQIRAGVLIAALVLGGFVIYAFFAPASYRSSALLVVEPIASGAPLALPEPLEAGRRLREGILDRATLDRLAQERAGSQAPDLRVRAASQVRDSLAVDTSDARAFGVSYTDSDAARAQRICGELAQRGVEQAPVSLDVSDRDHAAALQRQHQTQELAAFLTLHPEVASVQSNDEHSSDKLDVALSAMRAEKAAVERRLAEGHASENPYDDPAEADPSLLKRRLAELDSAIALRKKSLENRAATQKVSPALAAEYQRLIEAITSEAAPASNEPRLRAKLASQPTKSIWPIEPNRPLLLFFGLVFGVGLGTAYVLTTRTAQRRRVSSRPPTGMGATVVVPKAARVPADFRPVPGLGSTQVMPVARSAPPPAEPPPAAWRHQVAAPSDPPPMRPPSDPPPLRPPSDPPPMRPPSDPPRRPSSEPPMRPSRPPPQLAGAVIPTPLPPRVDGSYGAVRVVQDEDPVLAAAEQAWDRAVRTNNVPGFAVVGHSPPRGIESVNPPPAAPTEPAREPTRTHSRAAHKVTQPLGSFLPDNFEEILNQTANARPSAYPTQPPPAAYPSQPPPAAAARPGYPPRSPLPVKGSPSDATRYSYVSTPPPTRSNDMVRVEPVPPNWRPSPELNPSSQRALCEKLYSLALDRCLVLLVVGTPDVHERKSQVAAELALALAEPGHPRVLLLDGDFYRPCVQRMLQLDVPLGTGFSQQLHARVNGGTTRWSVLGLNASLHAIAEGVMRSPGLLLSQQFDDALREFRGYYDFIVVDGPTSSLEVDGPAVRSITDQIVLVHSAQASAALRDVEDFFAGKKLNLVQV